MIWRRPGTRPFRCRRAAKRGRVGLRYKRLIYQIFGPSRDTEHIILAIDAHGPIYLNAMTAIDEIVENFILLEEWDDRYRYVIELGRTLPPLAESAHTEANKVQGCASQVWLLTHVKPDGSAGPILTFEGDSDAHIVRGLVAILFALYSGKSAREILATDTIALFDRIGLRENLTPQRSNGLHSMVERIRAEANAALTTAA